MGIKRNRRFTLPADHVLRRLVRKRLEIAVRLDELLEERGWSARVLAQKAGMKESFLSRILHADANSTLKTLAKLEAALGEEIITVTGCVLENPPPCSGRPSHPQPPSNA